MQGAPQEGIATSRGDGITVAGHQAAAARTPCIVSLLGSMAYGEALAVQRDILRRRLAGETGDTLLLLEHPPTFTVGKSGKMENVLVPGAELSRRGISVFCTDRGGDVTYHGPGQLVGYPIFDLRRRGKDLRKYVRDLEEVMIRTLSRFSIQGERDPSHPGVWVANQEIAAIGIRVSKWITMHGFALNVKPDMGHFSLINPCGFRDRRATSMAELSASEIDAGQVVQELIGCFSDVFETDMAMQPLSAGAGHD